MSLFQDPSSVYVYNYAGSTVTPVTYASPVGGLLTNGAAYDTSSTTINSTDLSLNAAQSQYMAIPQAQTPVSFPTVTSGNGFTVAGWFYPVGGQAAGRVLFDLSGAGLARVSVYYGSTTGLTTYYNGGTGSTVGAANATAVALTPGAWHFFCYTVRCTSTGLASQALYLDGSAAVAIPNAVNQTALYAPFTVVAGTVGGKPPVAGSYFNGRLNDIRYYGRVLTAPEIRVLAQIYSYIGYLTANAANYPNLVTNAIPPVATPPMVVQGTFDPSAATVWGNRSASYGASIQIDVSGTFSYLYISRSPPFDPADPNLFATSGPNAGTTVLDVSNGLTLYASALGSPPLSLVPVSSTAAPGPLAFIDTTVQGDTLYTYTITPYIQVTAGVPVPAATLGGTTSIQLPPFAIQPIYDLSSSGVSFSGGLHGVTVQVDLSGVFNYVDVSRNPAFVTSEVAGVDPVTKVLRIYDASASLAPTTNAYITKTMTYTSSLATGVLGNAFIDTTPYPNYSYTYYFTPNLNTTTGLTVSAVSAVGGTGALSTSATGNTGLGALTGGAVASTFLPATSNGVSATPLTSTSIPGITIAAGGASSGVTAASITSAAAAVGTTMGGSPAAAGGAAASPGALAAAGGATNAALASGSAGTITASATSPAGTTLTDSGLSATGGAPVAPSVAPPAGTVSLASGSGTDANGVPFYTGSLPSTVSAYMAVNMSSANGAGAGSVTVAQAVTAPTPPAGATGNSGVVSFTAWPANVYDPGTTLTVMIGGVVLLSGYSFPPGTTDFTTFNLPFYNLPAGNNQVSIVVTNSNGSTSSAVGLGSVNTSFSTVLGTGSTATDPSGLILYYPMDVGTTVTGTTLLNNYASAIPTADASLCQGASLTGGPPASMVGNGDVSLNAGLGTYVQLGPWTCPTPATGAGFSVTGWIYPTVAAVSTNPTVFAMTNTTGGVVSCYMNPTNGTLDFSCNRTVATGVTGAEFVVPSNHKVPLNQWSFFAMTCRYTSTTTATYNYYVSDVCMGTVDGGVPDTGSVYTKNYMGGVPSSVPVAANGYGNLAGFTGYMDDFRLYNRTLGLNDVMGIWGYGVGTTATSAVSIVDPKGLVVYYPFEMGSVVT